MKIYYGLQKKTAPTVFICVSNSKEQFARKIDRAYWNWRGIQSRGSKPTLDDFLDDYIKVKLTGIGTRLDERSARAARSNGDDA